MLIYKIYNLINNIGQNGDTVWICKIKFLNIIKILLIFRVAMQDCQTQMTKINLVIYYENDITYK